MAEGPLPAGLQRRCCGLGDHRRYRRPDLRSYRRPVGPDRDRGLFDGGDLGTLRSKGTVSVGGHSAIEIVAPGSDPGSVSRSIDVTLVGTAYPVRLVVTARPSGSTLSNCYLFLSSAPPRAQPTLSKFGEPVIIAAPSPAVDFR